MSDTPRTDAIDGARVAQGTPQYHALLDLARVLERELAEQSAMREHAQQAALHAQKECLKAQDATLHAQAGERAALTKLADTI